MNRKTSQIHNGKLYMPELVGDKLEIYDIAADTTITKTLPNSMHRETSQVYNDKLYMPERSGNKLEIYDIATDTTATKTLPNSMGRVASQISGGKLYMPGEYNNELEIYDMATDTTETRILLNSTWWRFTSQIYNGKLYMAGNGGMLEIRDLRELNITFNGIPATNVTIVNSTTIIATTPAHTAGTVDVVVSTGAETVTLSSAYTYIDPTSPPVVPGVPNTGLR
jgi:hypothetical protein